MNRTVPRLPLACHLEFPVRGSALIGADGLWSNVRKQVVGDAAPRISGHTSYRSVIATEQMPAELRWNAATLWAGPKCHIVHYPLSGWKVFNLVVTYHNDAPEPVAGLPVAQQEVLKGFMHVHKRAQQIIRHGADWKQWVLCDREPVENWVHGRVTLLGDAAHPMLQYFAQGACMALEDAVCLAHWVDAYRHGPLALEVPDLASLNLPSLALTAGAMLAIFRFNIGMMPTLAACAVAGILYRFATGAL